MKLEKKKDAETTKFWRKRDALERKHQSCQGCTRTAGVCLWRKWKSTFLQYKRNFLKEEDLKINEIDVNGENNYEDNDKEYSDAVLRTSHSEIELRIMAGTP